MKSYVKFTLIDEVKKNVIKAEMLVNEFVNMVYGLQLEHDLYVDRNEKTGNYEVIVLGNI